MLTEQVKIKGIITKVTLRGDINEETKWHGFNILQLLSEAIRLKNFKFLLYLKENGIVQDWQIKRNLIATVGRSVLSERLAGGTTYSGEINYGALGTAVSPVPANSDTQLGNEVFRKLASSQAFSDNIAYVDFFYTATEVDGTFTEFGNFIDGGAGANTGKLWSYIATGGWVKTLSSSLFISCQYIIA